MHKKNITEEKPVLEPGKPILEQIQEDLQNEIHLMEMDHVLARGYEKYNEGWDNALARVSHRIESVFHKYQVAENVQPIALKTQVPVTHDPINHPSHYIDGGIETLDYILAKKMDFLTGQVCKYISRAGKKDPTKTVEDLKKAEFYLNRRIAELEKSEAQDVKKEARP